MININRCCETTNGGIQSVIMITDIEIIKLMYNKSDLRDGKVKRIYGRYKRQPIRSYLEAIRLLSISKEFEKITLQCDFFAPTTDLCDGLLKKLYSKG